MSEEFMSDECMSYGNDLPPGLCPHCDEDLSTPRPIETAPKDAGYLLLFDGQWLVGGWSMSRDEWETIEEGHRLNPTHWLPLPPAPFPR